MTSFFWGGGVQIYRSGSCIAYKNVVISKYINAKVCVFEFPTLLSIESAFVINHARPAMTALNLLVYFYID